MGQMTVRLIITTVWLLSLACDTNQPASDQSFFLRGQVIDSVSGLPITAAIVGYRNPTVADSLVFVGDSVDFSNANGFLISKATDDHGEFEFVFFLAARDTAVYHLLFAYKSGFALWRFDQTPVAITAGAEFVDRIVIPLTAH